MDNVIKNLIDLRIAFASDEGAQDRLLQLQYPPPYEPKNDRAIPEADRVESAGLDALIIVVRRIVSHLEMRFRYPVDPENPQQQRSSDFLRLCMTHFAAHKPEEIRAASYFVLKSFCGGGELRRADLTFLSLCEHDIVKEALWSRVPLLLFDPMYGIREEGTKKWKFRRTEIEGGDPEAGLPRLSLTRYSVGELGEVITDRFGSYDEEDSNAEITLQSHRPVPEVLRVHYKRDNNEPKGSEHLRRIVVDLKRLEGRPNVLSPDGSVQAHYALIAEVRLSTTPGKLDTVRTYDLDSQVIMAPSNFPAAHSDKMGRTGADYMLYYGRRGVVPPGTILPPETPWVPSASLVNRINQVLNARSPSPSPSPPPQAQPQTRSNPHAHSRESSRSGSRQRRERRGGREEDRSGSRSRSRESIRPPFQREVPDVAGFFELRPRGDVYRQRGRGLPGDEHPSRS